MDMLLTIIWAMLTYESTLACVLLLRAKKPIPDLPSDPSLRVAMIVTRAPSEPFSVVQQRKLCFSRSVFGELVEALHARVLLHTTACRTMGT